MRATLATEGAHYDLNHMQWLSVLKMPLPESWHHLRHLGLKDFFLADIFYDVLELDDVFWSVIQYLSCDQNLHQILSIGKILLGARQTSNL